MSVLRSSLRFAVTTNRFQALPSLLLIGGSSCARSRSWAALCLFSLLVSGLTFSLLCPASSQEDGSGSSGYTVSYSVNPVLRGKDFVSQDTLTNTVTATLTWHGDDPAPAVIVEEDAEASWFVDGAGTGTCSCGLPNPTHIEYPQDAYDFATQYTIYPAPAVGTTTITLPPVMTSGSTMLAYDWEETDNFVDLSYSVTPNPVILTLAGTTKDSSHQDNSLIGQGCTGTLSASPATLSDFQWTIPGDTFKSFVIGTNGSKPYGRVNYLSSADMTNSNPHWFWKKGDDFGTQQTVSCTAQASVNGVSIGTVTGQKTVSVWRPYFKFNATPQGVNIVGTPGTSGVEVVGNIAWDGSVGTPDLFRSYWGSAGIWQFTQLCNLYRYAPPPYFVLINTGGPVLDAEFNYSSKHGAPWPVNSTDAVPSTASR